MSNPESQQPSGESAEVLLAKLKFAVRSQTGSQEEYERVMGKLDSVSDQMVQGAMERNQRAQSQQAPVNEQYEPVVVEAEPVSEPEPAQNISKDSQVSTDQVGRHSGVYAVKPGETMLFPITVDELPYTHTDTNTNRSHYMAGVKAVLQAEVPVVFGIDGSVKSTAQTYEGVVVTDIDGMRHQHRRVVLDHFLKKDFAKKLADSGITDPGVVEKLQKKNIDEGSVFVTLKRASMLPMVSSPFAPDDGVKITIPENARWMHPGLEGVVGDAVDVFVHQDREEDGQIKLRLDTAPPERVGIMSHIGSIGVLGGDVMAVHCREPNEIEKARHLMYENNGLEIRVSSASPPISPEDVDDELLPGFVKMLALRKPLLQNQVVSEPEVKPAPEPEKPRSRTSRQKQTTGTERASAQAKQPKPQANNGQQGPENPFRVLGGASSPLIASTAPETISKRDAKRLGLNVRQATEVRF